MSYHPRRKEIIEWLRYLDVPALSGKTAQDMWEASYPTWGRLANAWMHRLGTGGTYTLRAIVWYQHVHKPGSTDSRPKIVLAAICEHLDTQEQSASTTAERRVPRCRPL